MMSWSQPEARGRRSPWDGTRGVEVEGPTAPSSEPAPPLPPVPFQNLYSAANFFYHLRNALDVLHREVGRGSDKLDTCM